MILGRVVGVLWATRKDPRLAEHKLALIEPYAYYDAPASLGPIVAIDRLDAAKGDDVVVCLGTPARMDSGGAHLPIDAAVMAIVDRCDVDVRALEHKRPFAWLRGQAPARLDSAHAAEE